MKNPPSTPIVVTGLGVVSAIGVGCDAFREAIDAGRHGIRSIERFATDEFEVHVGATIAKGELGGVLEAPVAADSPDAVAHAAVVAAREASAEAALDSVAPHRIAVILGTTAGSLAFRSKYELAPPAERLARKELIERSALRCATAAVAEGLGITGPRITISTACTSSTNAIGHGVDLLRTGCVDAVLAGGAEIMTREIFAGFYSMGAMSAAPCAPFSEPIGMNVGEGAGFVVLERADDAARRGRRARCVLLGYGLSLDAFHAISPEPTGAGVARAVQSALAHANTDATAVGYFNAHGTGTDANDPAEWAAVQRVFGARAGSIPVSSTKSYFGHALGAAGVLELAACVLCLERGTIPPTLNYTVPRGGGPVDCVAEARPRPWKYDVGVSNNSAFGGANAAVVYASPSTRAGGASRASGPVVVLGSAVIAAHGTHGFDHALRARRALGTSHESAAGSVVAARVPPIAVERIVRGVDLRGFDGASRMLTCATALALQDAEIRLSGGLRDRTGTVVATNGPSADTAAEFWDSIRVRGHAKISPSTFARIVVSASAGAVSRALSIRGPVSVVAGGRGSTLASMALGNELLAQHADVDLLAVSAVADLNLVIEHDIDHRSPVADGNPFAVYGHDVDRGFAGEAATSVIVARAGFGGHAARAEIAAFAMSGPDGLKHAIEEALDRAEWDRRDVDAIYGSADGDPAGGRAELEGIRAVFGSTLRDITLCNPTPIFGRSAVGDALSLAAALEALRTGESHPVMARADAPARAPNHVMVISQDRLTGSFVLLLRRAQGTRS